MAERRDHLDLGVEFPLTPPEPGPKTAQAVLEMVRLYPEMHFQGHWYSRYTGWRADENSEYAPVCKTTLCVAGWAQWLHEGTVNEDDTRDGTDVETKAAEYLGIKAFEANRLFYSGDAAAVAALEYLARGEEIDWDEVHRPSFQHG